MAGTSVERIAMVDVLTLTPIPLITSDFSSPSSHLHSSFSTRSPLRSKTSKPLCWSGRSGYAGQNRSIGMDRLEASLDLVLHDRECLVGEVCEEDAGFILSCLADTSHTD